MSRRGQTYLCDLQNGTYRMGHVSALNQVLYLWNFLKSSCLIYWKNRLPKYHLHFLAGHSVLVGNEIRINTLQCSSALPAILTLRSRLNEGGETDSVHSLFTCHTLLDSGALNDCWASNMFRFTVTWPHLHSLVAPFLASDPCRSM